MIRRQPQDPIQRIKRLFTFTPNKPAGESNDAEQAEHGAPIQPQDFLLSRILPGQFSIVGFQSLGESLTLELDSPLPYLLFQSQPVGTPLY